MEDGIENPIHRLFLITHTQKKSQLGQSGREEQKKDRLVSW